MSIVESKAKKKSVISNLNEDCSILVNLFVYLLSSISLIAQFSKYPFQTCASFQELYLFQHMILPPISQRKSRLLRISCSHIYYLLSKEYLFPSEANPSTYDSETIPLINSEIWVHQTPPPSFTSNLSHLTKIKTKQNTLPLSPLVYLQLMTLPLRAKLFIKRIVHIYCIHC